MNDDYPLNETKDLCSSLHYYDIITEIINQTFLLPKHCTYDYRLRRLIAWDDWLWRVKSQGVKERWNIILIYWIIIQIKYSKCNFYRFSFYFKSNFSLDLPSYHRTFPVFLFICQKTFLFFFLHWLLFVLCFSKLFFVVRRNTKNKYIFL